jgi:hypothetical protein
MLVAHGIEKDRMRERAKKSTQRGELNKKFYFWHFFKKMRERAAAASK